MEIFENQIFSAGFGLVGITAGLALLQKGIKHGVTFSKRRLLVTLEIPSKDQSYNWVLKWMESQEMKRKTHELSVETSFTRRDNGSTETRFSFLPGPGKHYFKFEGAWFQCERQRAIKMIDLKSGSPWETVTFTTLSRDRHLFQKILQESKEIALSNEVGKTVIYSSYGPEWRPSGNPKRKRPIDSVILDGNISSMILEDVKSFINGGKWYYDRGIPYRRGYLLHGPPGSGKTSFILSLAGALDYNICVLNLSERGMTDDRLSHLLSHGPPRTIILLEDIDAAFIQRNNNDKQGGFQSMVTFSGLLNALDGVTSSEERIIFMTTNHIERLDPALIRPGRVDVRVLIDNVTQDQVKRLFLRFYPEQHELAQSFTDKLSGLDKLKTTSAAQIQGHFLLHRDDAKQALDNIEMIIPKITNDIANKVN